MSRYEETLVEQATVRVFIGIGNAFSIRISLLEEAWPLLVAVIGLSMAREIVPWSSRLGLLKSFNREEVTTDFGQLKLKYKKNKEHTLIPDEDMSPHGLLYARISTYNKQSQVCYCSLHPQYHSRGLESLQRSRCFFSKPLLHNRKTSSCASVSLTYMLGKIPS